jgi:2-oxoglutarate dehydrogenase E1 component
MKEISNKILTLPEDFNLHPTLKRIFKEKKAHIESGQNLDWATCELLSYGSLLLENIHVRLSGQDVERGTFSHRNSVLVDQVEFRKNYIPLNNLAKNQGFFDISNSNLSEFGVLGFEYGYASESPQSLIIWEGQFGDFSNGAQIIIDQFLSSGEDKWLRQNGLVMLLPHGYEGQGPEHSSCRLERYLQMCNEDADTFPEMDKSKRMQIQNSNWQVVNCSTPANFFHVLRRQVHRDFRKPLIIATPKSLLRNKLAVSSFEDMKEGTRFKRVISERKKLAVSNDKVRTLIFCSGKIYYDLFTYREEKKIEDVAIITLEQLNPFPFDRVNEEANKYKNAKIIFCQEEPKNMGSWMHVQPRIMTSLRGANNSSNDKRIVSYVGRVSSSSPASGFLEVHKHEQNEILEKAFQ